MFQEKERELNEARKSYQEAASNARKSAPTAPTPARPTISRSALARDVQGLTPDTAKRLIAAAKLKPAPNADSSWELYDREAAMAAASVYLSEFPAERLREVNEKLRDQGVRVSDLQKSLSAYETGSKSPKALQRANDELRALLVRRQAEHDKTRQELVKAGQEVIALKAALREEQEKEPAAAPDASENKKIAELEALLAAAIKARQQAEDREQAAIQRANAAPAEKPPAPAQGASVVGGETVQRIRNLQADLLEKEREIETLSAALTEANAKLATKNLVPAGSVTCPECGSTNTYKFRGGKRMGCKSCNSEMAVA